MSQPAPFPFSAIPSIDANPLPDPRRLRVAVFSDSLPERNGAGAYYADLVAQLEGEVGAIELFQPARTRRMLRLAVPLPGDPTQKLITPNVFRLRRQFQQMRPHVVVAVTPGPFGLLGLFFAKRHQAAFLTGFHTHFEALVKLYGGSLFFRLAFVYLEQVNKFLCRRSDAVIVNNRDLIPTVRRLGAPAVEVMGTPLARSFLEGAAVEAPARLQRVLFAGRLAPEKNLPAVLEAARALPQVTFAIAGDGPLRAKVEAAAAELPNLELLGWLDRPALCAEMDRASLLLLPSHLETFGTVALEAMARGRPALVSERAGIHDWELLRPALFSLPEGQSIATALLRIRDVPETEWREKAEAARRVARQLNRETVHQWVDCIQRHAGEHA